MRIVLRSVLAPLWAPETYLRVVFVMLGSAIALALGIADFIVLSLVVGTGMPAWAVATIGVILVGGPLLIGLVPAMRKIEGVAVEALLIVGFPEGLPGVARGWPQRARTLAWFVLHILTGAVPVLAVMGLIGVGSPWATPGAFAVLLVAALLGRGLAVLGPRFFGPSYAERLQRLEADAARATERNRLAREIHDSIGHSLSLVTVQASAARKLFERDPAFTQEALATIEATSRGATVDLDHLLGLLRDEHRPEPSGRPALGPDSLDGLIGAASAAGLRVGRSISGDLTRLPALVAQEAYRIIQEGLTNALKYSADGTATLEVSLTANRLNIRLSNPADQASATSRVGRGLSGIKERAGTLGGSSSAHDEGGRWTLSVMLPAVPS